MSNIEKQIKRLKYSPGLEKSMIDFFKSHKINDLKSLKQKSKLSTKAKIDNLKGFDNSFTYLHSKDLAELIHENKLNLMKREEKIKKYKELKEQLEKLTGKKIQLVKEATSADKKISEMKKVIDILKKHGINTKPLGNQAKAGPRGSFKPEYFENKKELLVETTTDMKRWPAKLISDLIKVSSLDYLSVEGVYLKF